MQFDGEDTGGDLASQVGDAIKVTLDRWSVGQLGPSDLIVTGAAVRAVVEACDRAGIGLDGPQWMALDAGTSRIGPS